jgi:rhodanese-related sulfurtransferase
MEKITGLIIGLLLFAAQGVSADIAYNYINSDSFMKILQEKPAVHMVDIQKKNDYLRHHFAHSVGTSAYPVKTDREKNRINEMLSTLQTSKNPIIIIGPRGTRAEQRTFAYLLDQGIAPQRLAILEKGTRGWPAPEMLLNTSGQ